ncbi:unnamed protein product [Periconia digitata]|uniref:Ribosome assembly protein 3 n=1 Tax=Periconia digitata TaxID=1303443 RepID=A0A9W4UN50_9PLEO|nr:unnamed protein product [Periconia digitata]
MTFSSIEYSRYQHTNMAATRAPNGVEKRTRKKNKSRTVVDVSSSSSSETDSESDSGTDVSETKKDPAKSKQVNSKSSEDDDSDTEMPDANASASTKLKSKSQASTAGQPRTETDTDEEFAAMYLRKVTGELGDDLIKVREAQDFKSSSLPMLVHALKQGRSMYSIDEKKRVVGATAGQAA